MLSLLLTLALLLCHGELGFMHEIPHGCDGAHPMLLTTNLRGRI